MFPMEHFLNFFLNIFHEIHLLATNVPYHIETGQFICTVNQLTGFYMMGNIGG